MSCGSCKFFQKFQNLGKGICDKYDYACRADSKPSCQGYKRIKFHRNIAE